MIVNIVIMLLFILSQYKAKNKKNKGIVAIYDDKKIMRESEEI